MILLVGSEKGGTGKTTIATNLAALRAAECDVLLVDSDKQGTASVWSATRSEYGLEPSITCVSKLGPSTGFDIVKLKDKFSTIIVDAGGRDSVEMRSAMVIADRMVLPIRPSQFDVWTLTTMDQLVQDARARGNESLSPLLCINLASPHPSVKEALEVIDLVREFETFSVASTIIHERTAFRRAAREGCSVSELVEGDNRKAIHEITTLYNEIFHEQTTQKTPL